MLQSYLHPLLRQETELRFLFTAACEVLHLSRRSDLDLGRGILHAVYCTGSWGLFHRLTFRFSFNAIPILT